MTELVFYLTEIESREQEEPPPCSVHLFISFTKLFFFFFSLRGLIYLFMKKHTNLDLFLSFIVLIITRIITPQSQ